MFELPVTNCSDLSMTFFHCPIVIHIWLWITSANCQHISPSWASKSVSWTFFSSFVPGAFIASSIFFTISCIFSVRISGGRESRSGESFSKDSSRCSFSEGETRSYKIFSQTADLATPTHQLCKFSRTEYRTLFILVMFDKLSGEVWDQVPVSIQASLVEFSCITNCLLWVMEHGCCNGPKLWWRRWSPQRPLWEMCCRSSIHVFVILHSKNIVRCIFPSDLSGDFFFFLP